MIDTFTWATITVVLCIVACLGWVSAYHYAAEADDIQAALHDIQQQRSDIVRRGNYTRAAKRKAAINAKAEQIRKEIGR